MYIGKKGKDRNGNTSNSFLARNGLVLAYGSWYYLNGANFPYSITVAPYSGTLDKTYYGQFYSSKFKDVGTNTNDPTQAVVGNQNYGVFVLDFSLYFQGGRFNSTGSTPRGVDYLW